MKKWHTVLWIVFASLALSGVSFVLFRPKHWTEIKVARVNGQPVYFDEFRKSLLDIHARINSLRPLAQAYGMSEEMFLSAFLGISNPEEFALDNCIKEKLLNHVTDQFSITLNDAWFKMELIKSLPQLIDERGNINMDLYLRYLERISMTPAEYEGKQREDFKRRAVQYIIDETAHVPLFIAKDLFTAEHTEKEYSIIRLPVSLFIDKIKKETVTDTELEQFYQKNNSDYRVNEKRQAIYWILSPTEYTKKIDIDAALVRDFYEKHKGTLFRIPPKIKVRHIFIPLTENKARDLAHEIHKQVMAQPDNFAQLAKQYSKDTKTAKSGGLLDFFSRGTHDAEFERAAFRLRNEGEISKIIKTKQGYEIIQLAERIKASEKSFDTVKDDISKTLRAKRSLAFVRNDLESLMRGIKEDEKTLDKFIQQHNLTVKETGLLEEDSVSSKGIDSVFAKKLFSKNKNSSGIGYFLHEDNYVIYKISKIEKSYVPTFSEIKNKLLNDYYQEKAEKLAKNMLKDLRVALLNKKTTLDAIAQEYKVNVTHTAAVKKGSTLPELSGDGALRERLSLLTDSDQVLEYMHKNTLYLAQISRLGASEEAAFKEQSEKIIKQEKYKTKKLHQSAFIASLYRNAKIVIDQKSLEVPRVG